MTDIFFYNQEQLTLLEHLDSHVIFVWVHVVHVVVFFHLLCCYLFCFSSRMHRFLWIVHSRLTCWFLLRFSLDIFHS